MSLTPLVMMHLLAGRWCVASSAVPTCMADSFNPRPMLQTTLSGASRRETQISVHKKQEVIQQGRLLHSCSHLQLMLSGPLF